MINTRISSNVLASRIASDIVQQQNDLAKIQAQISTGKRVNRPSDDPSQAAHILQLQEAVSKLEQYQRNASSAESQLSMQETSLDGVSDVLNRVRELSLSANNGVMDDAIRNAHNSEIKLALEELYDLANVKDSFGNYLFSGSNSQVIPFASGTPVIYSGSDDGLQMDVGLGRAVQTSDPGTDVFMRIRTGNGTFQVEPNQANTGTGLISQGSVVNRNEYEPNTFEIQFTSDSSYDIIDTTNNTSIQSGTTYESGDPIEFNGITTAISGSPKNGDSFSISPSANQDVFTTVAKLSEALDNSPSNSAEEAVMQQDINAFLSNIDQALEHINTARAGIGTRMSSIDQSREENEDIQLQLETTRSDIEDIDIAEAITNLQTKVTSLDILQKTFTQVESLSLFNYM